MDARCEKPLLPVGLDGMGGEVAAAALSGTVIP